jgi:NitT/TauT family transport system substrate-binding protein
VKKLLSLILVALFLLAPLASCQTPAPTPPAADPTVRIAGMKGPTSIGLVTLAKEAEKGDTKNKYNIDMTYGKADGILPKLLGGELDMAALPANVATSVYNSSNGKIRVLAINTLGVVNIVERGNSIHSLDDLVGKKIYAVGKGTTPEYALRYLCAENDVDYNTLQIEWRNEATEILPLLKTGEGAVAMIPQPFVTAAQMQVEGLRIALNFNEEWEKLENNSTFVTGVMVVRTAFLEQYPQVVADFLDEYEDSVMATYHSPDGVAALTVEYWLIAALPLAERAVVHCAQMYIDGAEMKAALSSYLQTLYNLAPASIGGMMPKDNFYYVPNAD